MMTEFACMDCGYRVHTYASARTTPRCLTCQFIEGLADPAERERLRAIMSPGAPPARGPRVTDAAA